MIFEKIFSKCGIRESYNRLKDIKLFSKESNVENVKSITKDWINEGDNKKYMKFNQRLLSIILKIIRNNASLIWNLGSSYKALKRCGIEDELLLDVMNSDSESMKELATELIINKAITKENSVSFKDLFDGIFYIIRQIFDEEKVENEIMKNMFNCTSTSDQKKNYSIKDDYLQKVDTNYILSPTSRATAEKYLYNFKKDNVSIFNKYFYKVNKYEEGLSEKIYENILFKKENFDFIIQIIGRLINREEFSELQPYFLNILLNYFDVFLELDNKNFREFKDFHKKEIDKLIALISNNNLKNEFYKSYCNLIIQKVNPQKQEEEKNSTPENGKKLNFLKLKKKLVGMTKNKIQLFSINKLKNEPKETTIYNDICKEYEKEQCLFCRKDIDYSSLKNCYGKIGYLLFDNYIHNAFFQTVKKEFDKQSKIKNIVNVKKCFQPSNYRSLRIISCGHNIHFTCFVQNYTKPKSKKKVIDFICPICQKYNNTFIPDINKMTQYITDEKFRAAFNSFDYEYILSFSENENIFKDFVLESKEISGINLIQEFHNKKSSNNKNQNTDNLKKYIIDNYSNIFYACKYYIQGFLAVKTNQDTLLDIEDKKFAKTQYMELFYSIMQYRDFMDYFENTAKKNQLIFAWRNLALCFRMFLKVNIMKNIFFPNFHLFLYKMYHLETNSGRNKMLLNDHFRYILSGILFFICVFFDYKDIKGYEKYILLIFLPVYLFEYYLRKLYLDNSLSYIYSHFSENMNYKNFENYVLSDKEVFNTFYFIIKKLYITNCILKNETELDENCLNQDNMLESLNMKELKDKKNMFEILDTLEKMVEEKDDVMRDEEIFSSYYNYKETFNLFINDQNNLMKNGECEKRIYANLLISCLPVKYDFIELPKLAVDFFEQTYNNQC